MNRPAAQIRWLLRQAREVENLGDARVANKSTGKRTVERTGKQIALDLRKQAAALARKYGLDLRDYE